LTADTLAALRSLITKPPFHGFMQPEVLSADREAGTVTLRIPFKRDFQRAPDAPQIHGGVIAALIDIAGHAAVAARVGHAVPTINIRVDFLSMAADQSDLFAHARLLRAGRSIAVVDVEVKDERDKAVAVGRGTFGTMER